MLKRLLLLALFTLEIFFVFANQGVNLPADFKFSTKSPYHTVASHLFFLKKGSVNTSIAAYTLDASSMSISQKLIVAEKLKEIILKREEFLLSDVPDEKNYKNLAGDKLYILFPDIPDLFLVKNGGKWLYSQRTVEQVDKIHAKLFPKKVRPILKRTVLDLNDVKISKEELSLVSPYHTLYSIIAFLDADNYHPEYTTVAINAPSLSDQEKIEKLIKITQVFYARGRTVELARVPKNPNYVDSAAHTAGVYIVDKSIPEVYLEKVGEEWMISNATIALIDDLHDQIFLLGTERLDVFAHRMNTYFKSAENWLPGQFWKGVGFVLFIASIFLLYIFLVWFLGLIVKLLSKARELRVIVARILSPLGLLVAAWYFELVAPSLGIDHRFFGWLIVLDQLALVVFSMLILYHSTDLWVYFVTKRRKSENLQKKGLVPFFAMLIKISIFLVGIVWSVNMLGYDTAGLLAGISIGGVALALAAQDTIRNFFGSVMIFMDEPFVIGDWIITDTISGDIEEIGLRSTRIRTFHNSVVSIPNGKLADLVIDNLGKRRYRRYKTNIKISYDTPLEDVKAFQQALKDYVLEHPKIWNGKYFVELNELGSYSIHIMLYIFFRVPTWAEELQLRNETIYKVLELAELHKVKIAIPENISINDNPSAN